MEENTEYKFTKELKDKWISELKSGKWEQFGDKLQGKKDNQACCLNVVRTLLPGVGITKDKLFCEIKGKNCSYDPFEQLLGKDGSGFAYYSLTMVNDKSYDNGIRDYSEVIPLIEALPTVD